MKAGFCMVDKKFQEAIDRILNDPPRSKTKEEAKQSLIACGILNEDGSIADAYKDIIKKKED